MALNLPVYRGRYPVARAYFSGAYTMAEIGAHFGVHYMTVSRAVRAFEQCKDNDEPTRDDWDLLDC